MRKNNNKRLALVPRMIELRKQGLTLRAISKELGMGKSPGVVAHYLKQYGKKEFTPTSGLTRLLTNRISTYKKEVEWLKNRINKVNTLIVDAETELDEVLNYAEKFGTKGATP